MIMRLLGKEQQLTAISTGELREKLRALRVALATRAWRPSPQPWGRKKLEVHEVHSNSSKVSIFHSRVQ